MIKLVVVEKKKSKGSDRNINETFTGEITGSKANFKNLVKQLWFGMYPRVSGKLGSSGFEHVFLGELKNGITGLHSWLRYYIEEKNGLMNYLGYIRTRSIGTVKFATFSSILHSSFGESIFQIWF